MATTCTKADFERLSWHDCTIWGLEVYPPDLRIAIEWGTTGVLLHEISIDRMEREPVSAPTVFRARPSHRWRIKLNWPPSGEIVFDAVGFTQTLVPRSTRGSWLASQF